MKKIMTRFVSYSVLLLLFLILGCSSSKSSPVIPENPQADINLPATELNTSESFRSILGAWTLSINHETLEATVTPNRALDYHYNVKYLIPTPEVVINTIHPNYVIDADVTLTNPYTFPAYDVRLIIFTDEYGHFLDNADVWTGLYDIPAGQDINPFKAYAKDQPNRIFEGESQHTENLLVFNPPPGHPIQFAIDASYPGNCEEPYAFENFQQGALYPHVGENAIVTVDVLDWQNDVSEVYLQCPEITNEPETQFEFVSSNRWQLNLINNTGAPVGNYPAYLLARSSNSGSLALHDKIIITVSSGIGIPLDLQIVGTIELDSVLFVNDIAVNNGYAYVATAELPGYASCAMQIFDINDPSNPVYLSSLNDFNSYNIEADDEYVFILGSVIDDYVYSINVQNPLLPQVLSQSSASYFPRDLAFEEDMAIAACSYYWDTFSNQGAIYRYDVSDPMNIRRTGSVTSAQLTLYSIAISQDYVYVSSTENGLMVIDTSDPASINIAATFDSLTWGHLATQGNYLYHVSTAFSVVDISAPVDPRIIASLDSLHSMDIVVSGDYAYLPVVEHPAVYLKVVDISDPTNPYIFSTLDLQYYTNMMKLEKYENYLYATKEYMFNQAIEIIQLW